MYQYLLLLAIIPIACYNLAKMYRPSQKWILTGISAGLVVAPVSLALMQFVYIPGIGKMIGAVGTLVNLIHGPVGYFAAIGMGLQEPGVLFSISQLVLINVVNGLFWGSFYGVIGLSLDRKQIGQDEHAYEASNV